MRRPTHLTATAAAAAAVAVALAGCSAPVTAAEEAPAHHIAYLWAVGAEDAAFVETGDAMYVELSGVEAVITRFSDRPDREASEVDLRDFLARWEGRFAEVPPNAVLSYQLEEGAAPVQIVAEISRPRFNEATSTIVFAAEIIEYTPDTLEGADHPVDAHETVIPAHTGPVSLFIDSVGPEASPAAIALMAAETAAVSDALNELETLLAQTQSTRATALEAQLQSSLAGISAQNNRVAELYSAFGEVDSLLSTFHSDAGPDTALSGAGLSTTTAAALASLGLDVPSAPTRGDLDTLVVQITSSIDSVSNAQQLDLMRLQSTVDNRSEAYELMSNFNALMQDSRSSIINNMR